jgi:hypothetical protein
MHINVARAVSLIDAARMHTFRATDDVQHGIDSGMPLDGATRAGIRMDAAAVVTSARPTLSLLLDVSGSSSFASDQPLQRIWRDLEVMIRHQLLFPGLGEEIYGWDLLGVSNSGHTAALTTSRDAFSPPRCEQVARSGSFADSTG